MKTISIAAVITGTLGATPAFAGTQQDIAECRAAVTAQNPTILDGYRLRFKKTEGFRERKLLLEAIPNKKSAGERFALSCKISRKNTVLAVNTDKTVKLAKK